jgi:RimJ/RimL family protein N-acetyltransferase
MGFSLKDAIQMTTLLTERLVLQPLTALDSRELFAARGDREVMAFWDAPQDATHLETTSVLERLLAEMENGTAQHWSARLQKDASFVGVCDLSDIRSDTADIGFMLLRKFWGLGFGSEIVHSLVVHAESLGVRTLSARIHSANTRSRALLLRAGFRPVKLRPRYEIRPGEFRDCEWFEAEVPSASQP